MRRHLPLIIVILTLLGLIDSLYLTLVHFDLISYEAPVSTVCMFHGGNCETALSSGYADLLGVPAGIWGMLYYLGVLGMAGVRLATGKWPVPRGVLGLMSAAALYSAFLIYVMVAIIHVPCPYCLAAHFINFLMLAVYATHFRGDQGLPLIKVGRGRQVLAH